MCALYCSICNNMHNILYAPRLTNIRSLHIAALCIHASMRGIIGQWSCVEVKLVEKWSKPVLLSTLKACPALAAMTLFRQSRLSVQVVSPEHWAYICDTLRHA